MKFREARKRHWSNIKVYEARTRGGGVDKVDIDTENGIQTVTDHNGMVEEIIKANRQKRLQANNTPF